MPDPFRPPQPAGPLMAACAEWARVPAMQLHVRGVLSAIARAGGDRGAPPEVRRQAAQQSALIEAHGRSIGAHVARTFRAANDEPMAPTAPSAA